MSHFIGGKIGIATFFILNRAFWKQVAIEHTPTLSPGVGDSGLHVNIRQSHEIKLSQRYNHLAFQLILTFLET